MAKPSSFRSRVRDVALVVIALAVGVAASVTFLGRDEAAAPGGVPDLSIDADAAETLPVRSASNNDVAPGQGATSPRAALEAFLEAETARDDETSWDVIALADRRQHGSLAAWRQAHADLLPLTSAEVVGEDVAGERARFVTEATLRSTLDPVVGLVPARARITWTVVREGDAWFVTLAPTSVEPHYPPDAEAAPAATAWLASPAGCTTETADLVGRPDLLRKLCESGTTPRVGPVARLDDGPDVAPLIAAYGEAVGDWSRVVAVRGAVDLDLVLAPVADRWTPIAVLPPA